MGSNELGDKKGTGRVEISGSLIARNTFINLIGQALPLLVAVIAIPFIIQGLGTERFGLLAMAWAVLGSLAIFDLGLGRATTKYVAEALGKGDEDQVPQIIWTSVTVQAIIGLLGTLVLFGITPLLVDRALNIPPELTEEAKAMFYILAFGTPVVLVSGSFQGVLEAAQRFDLLNAVKIPSNIAVFLLPLVGVLLGLHLSGIVALILMARFANLIAFVVISQRILPQMRRIVVSFTFLPRIFAYGGWIMIINIANPILIYLDRFLIGSLISMAAVSYYSAPYEMASRLQIIPASLTLTLFTAFSVLEGIKDKQKLSMLFARSIKFILLVLGPIILLMALFSKEILQIWLGPEFARESAVILQILGVGILINSLAYVPSTLLSGAGRPDIPAKLHLLELPIYAITAWFLIRHWGIEGGATAWTLRVTLDAILLFWAVFKVYRFSLNLLTINGTIIASFAVLVFAGLAYGLKNLVGELPVSAQILVFIGLIFLFAWSSWKKVLDASDQRTIIRTARLWRKHA